MNKKIEQYTEALTQQLMGFTIGENDFGYVYPQGNVTDISKIENLLKEAGGKPSECELNDFTKGGLGKSKPEYIATFKQDTNTIIVIECKKQTKQHRSANYNRPNNYAVDGALFYAKFLKKEYNVIAIGISGTEQEKSLVDIFYWMKGQEEPSEQIKLHNIFLKLEDYLKVIKGERISKQYSLDEIRNTALIFHDKLRTIKLTERQKPIFIAGILIALEDQAFINDYANLSTFSSIITQLNLAIDNVLFSSDIRKENINNVKSAFKLIGNNSKLKEISLNEDGSIRWYIEQLEMKIKPMMNNADSSLDALGVFYHEFVKYSGGDGKGLGIVLTPQHLTEFMCDLAEINKNSRVVDICCGSASFLVTAMNRMFKETADPNELANIRKSHLYGVELDQDLYILAIANMIIRKDGKSNILYGDCFNKNIINTLKSISQNNLDVGLLNPPYSQKDLEELEFIEQLLSVINKGGKAVVVVPMSCAVGTKFQETRKRLLEKHTLKAVFSMPDDIFYPTGTNVCVMVWEAHKSHKSDVKTFFGYYKDDGFVKRKKLGRIDVYNQWEKIRKQWVQLYRNSEEHDGLTAKQYVGYKDEWLCEAYMKTDYSQLTKKDFEKTVKNYLAYLVSSNQTNLDIQFEQNAIQEIDLNTQTWKEFTLTKLFDFDRGKRLTKEDRILGNIPLITAGEGNQGVKEHISNAEQSIFSNRITIDMFCNSYFHEDSFCCDDNILALKSKVPINKYTSLFIATVINNDKYKYQYGRQYRIKNFKKHIIKLPVTLEGNPDWKFMERYVKQLSYADRV